MTYLEPFVLLTVDILDDFRVVDVDQVGSDSHNWTILVMQALKLEVRIPRVGLMEIPEPGPFWGK